jgi:leader peptidase (prepilin peptidase)/N-methyltransferase
MYIVSALAVLFIVGLDIKERMIPDVWLWPLLLCGLALFGGEPSHVAAAAFGYTAGLALFFAASFLFKKEALGFGDVKLLAVAGLWLGVNGLSLAVVYACAAGVLYGLLKKQRYIPFAPFLAFGAGAYYLTETL